MNNDQLKNYADEIANHLGIALNLALQMQQSVVSIEGDSDLYRKLAFYLTPTLAHWVNGAQAGNMKDLRELFERRAKEEEIKMQEQSYQGDGHDVLTKPSA